LIDLNVDSLAIGFWLIFFPESPKFLLECGETDAALEVLKDIYQQNTGNERSQYPVSGASLYSRVVWLNFDPSHLSGPKR
jgi:hypothetical protein